MAQLKCGFCQNTTFELTTEQPKGSRFPLSVVRCLACDVPIGVLQMEDAVPTIRHAAQLLMDRLQQMEDRLAKRLADIQDQFPSP